MDAGPFPMLPPPEWWRPESAPDPAKDGEYIKYRQQGWGDLSSDHTDEGAPEDMRGKADAVDVEAINEAWVLKRLVKEATDFGTRTRQSSRVKALELIGKNLAMFTEVVEHRDPVREAMKGMTPLERKERIIELALRMASDPALKDKFAAFVAKGKF